MLAAGWSSEPGDEMKHREFLTWLKPQLDRATLAGLSREAVDAIRDQLEGMSKAGALQPFASRLRSLVREHTTLDAKTVVGLAADIRTELAPPREKTVVLSAPVDDEEADD
jgi:hypothetical protein